MDGPTQYALAYALTTSAGLRGLLTLAVVSVAAHAGVLHPPLGFAWLGATQVTIALIAVAFVDLAADKIPVVDHAMHVLQVVVKPVCAAILVGGTLHPQSESQLVALMALGIFNALGIHAVSAGVRGTSTAMSGGIANPFVSTGEDVLAVVMSGLAFIAPFVAAACAVAMTVVAVLSGRTLWQRLRRVR